MKLRKIIFPFFVTIILVAATVGLVYAATSAINGKTYTHPSKYSTSSYKIFHGVDVSYWQGAKETGSNVNWVKVKNAGVDYAILRCGYSPTTTSTSGDSTCAYNITNAYSAGVSVGLYYYSDATTTAQAVKEANYAVSIANTYPGKITLPIVMDYEENLGTKSTMTACAKAFCDTVKAAGYTPMIYTYYSLANTKLDFTQLSSYKFWLAQYNTSTDFSNAFEYWQYTSTGSVSGINGNVDRDFWYYNNSAVATKSGTTSLKNADVTLSGTSFDYTGSKIEPAVTVKYGDTTLTKGTDYITMYFHNVKTGTSYVIVRGIGNYSNEVLKTFYIRSPATITTEKSAYGLSNDTSSLSLDATTNGGALTYSSSDSSIVQVSSAGVLSTTSKIGTATIKITSAATSHHVATTKNVSVKVVTRPGQVTLKYAKKYKRNYFKAKWTKKSGVTGYKVRYSYKKSFSKHKTVTVKGASNVSKVVKDKYSSKSKYVYVKVRAYKTVNGCNIYGSYSKVKKVKIR